MLQHYEDRILSRQNLRMYAPHTSLKQTLIGHRSVWYDFSQVQCLQSFLPSHNICKMDLTNHENHLRKGLRVQVTLRRILLLLERMWILQSVEFLVCVLCLRLGLLQHRSLLTRWNIEKKTRQNGKPMNHFEIAN